tara:strand:+ start:1104 stop:1229 length:126 start_codon:yes stop_codon:yes gene_type:complete
VKVRRRGGWIKGNGQKEEWRMEENETRKDPTRKAIPICKQE